MKAPSSKRRRARVVRAYTMVEVMMALAILAVGAVGVISLQKVAVLGGLNARNLTSASDVAASWLNVMQGEATSWNDSTNGDVTVDTLNMPLLAAAMATPETWVAIPTTGSAPAPHYPLGSGTNLDQDSFAACANGCTGPIVYCTHVRAAYLGKPGTADTIRVEVRTFFARNGRDVSAECALGPGPITTAQTDVNGTINSLSRYEFGFVNMTGTVRRNTFQ